MGISCYLRCKHRQKLFFSYNADLLIGFHNIFQNIPQSFRIFPILLHQNFIAIAMFFQNLFQPHSHRIFFLSIQQPSKEILSFFLFLLFFFFLYRQFFSKISLKEHFPGNPGKPAFSETFFQQSGGNGYCFVFCIILL